MLTVKLNWDREELLCPFWGKAGRSRPTAECTVGEGIGMRRLREGYSGIFMLKSTSVVIITNESVYQLSDDYIYSVISTQQAT